MENKLDLFSKIIIATGTINYMASVCNNALEYQKSAAANMQKQNPYSDSLRYLNESAINTAEAIQKLHDQLCQAIENIGNFMDGCDMVSHIDTRLYKVPLNILLHGMDEYEKQYPNE